MNTRRLLGTVPGVVLLSLLPVSGAWAKGYQLEIGGFTGGHFFSSDNGIGRVRGQPEPTELDHTGLIGLRLGYFFHPHVGLEAELAVIPTATHAANVNATLIGYRGHLVINLLTGRVRPFLVVGGGGLASTSSNHNVILVDNDGEVHAGIGLKAELDRARHVGIRLDARVQFSPGLVKDITEDWEVLIGLYGVIGGFHKPPPREAPEVVEEPAGDRDHDGDGVVDRLDKCPHDAETKNGFQDDDGCPDEVPAPAPTPQPQSFVVEGIQFRAGKADLEPTSFPVLDRVAKTLLDHPNVKLEIGGHTDESGTREQNHALSQKRADAVRGYLMLKGVPPERMTAVGHGSDQPLDDNHNDAGRARNRRVEMKFSP